MKSLTVIVFVMASSHDAIRIIRNFSFLIFFPLSLISYLVPELQSFEDTKVKAKSIKIDQICDVTYVAFRFEE